MVDYFCNIYASNHEDMKLVLDCIHEKINLSQNRSLTKRVEMQEVKTALFDMEYYKSLGPDGLSPGFVGLLVTELQV